MNQLAKLRVPLKASKEKNELSFVVDSKRDPMDFRMRLTLT